TRETTREMTREMTRETTREMTRRCPVAVHGALTRPRSEELGSSIMARKKPAASVPLDAHKHVADKRPNIPTRETAAFAADDGPPPFVVGRDRSLDPQLVWKGKDEKDARPLEVPAVPI